MTVVDGYANGGRGNPDTVVMKDLARFVHHFHFFFGVAGIQEIVDMGQTVVSDLMGVEVIVFALRAFFEILVALDAGAGNRLIRRIDDSADPVIVVNRL